tara:strand:- start:113 stop:517 length:405 start_codon:yes stop_codon:yes gene_type:complete
MMGSRSQCIEDDYSDWVVFNNILDKAIHLVEIVVAAEDGLQAPSVIMIVYCQITRHLQFSEEGFNPLIVFRFPMVDDITGKNQQLRFWVKPVEMVNRTLELLTQIKQSSLKGNLPAHMGICNLGNRKGFVKGVL